MKSWRVLASASVVTALLLFAFLVPVPVSRIRGHAVVQADPDPSAPSKVYVLHEAGGILTKLNIRPGNSVQAGEVLAEFRDPELDAELLKADIETRASAERIKVMESRFDKTTDPDERTKIRTELAKLADEHGQAEARFTALEKKSKEELVLRAPCSGIIGIAPSIEDVTRYFQYDPQNPFCTINNPGRVRVCLPLVTPDFNRLKQDLEQLTPAANRTRNLMKRRVTLSYNNARLTDVLADLNKQVTELKWTLDNSTVPEELTVTYRGDKDQRLGMELDELLRRMGLGYVIVSEKGNPNDGHLLIRPGRERGEPKEGRPMADLDVTIRIQGRDSQTWKGKIRQLPESEAKTVPLILSNRAGGPVAVKAMAGAKNGALVPSTQHYLVYVEILDPDELILPGTMAQVKIYCQPETCVHWLWRTLNETFDLGLM